MTKKAITLLLITFIFVFCDKEQNEVISPQAHTIDRAEKLLLETSNELGYKFFSKLVKQKKNNENIVISPINITLGFNTLLNASEDATKKKIKQYLRISHLKDTSITNGFDRLNKLFLEIDKNTIIKGVNTIKTRNQINFEDKFKKFIASRSYIETSSETSFDNEKTNSYAKNFFELTNSFGFDSNICCKKGSSELPFYTTPDESNFVKMTGTESELNFYSDPSIQAVELPLGRGNFNLLMIIPYGSQTLTDLATKLDARLVKRIRAKFKVRPIEVHFPVLDLTGTETFKSFLKNSRINSIFKERKGNFVNMSTSDIFLSDFNQETHIAINSFVNQQTKPLPETKSSLLIDRPFLFLVYEKFSGAIIILGKVNSL